MNLAPTGGMEILLAFLVEARVVRAIELNIVVVNRINVEYEGDVVPQCYSGV